jgi:peptidyl-prolyl cis-trans isomerase C
LSIARSLSSSALIVLFLTSASACKKAPATGEAAGSSPAAAAQTSAGQAVATGQPAPGTAPAGTPQAADPAAAAAGIPGAPGAVAPPPVKPVPAELPTVLARVNGSNITRKELERAIGVMEAQAKRKVPAEQRDRVYRDVLEQLVTVRVLEQEAAARKITVSDKDIDDQIAELRKQFPDEATFGKELAARGLSVADLRSEARSQIAISRMMDAEVTPKAKVDERAVKAFYDENPNEFQQPERFRASHILLRVEPTATDAQKKEARTTLEGLLAQVRGGADFAALAKAHSQDGSAPNGGDLNYFQRGQMVEPFQKAVDGLKVGEVSGIVETQFGYHIVKLTDKQPARTVPLAEASPKIGQFLLRRAQQQVAGEFVQSVRAKGKIEILI